MSDRDVDIDQSLGLNQSTLPDRVLLYIATGTFILLIILASLQVVIRVVPVNLSMRWTEALARFTLIIGTYFGAAVATRNREHIKINLFLNWIEGKSLLMNKALKVLIGGIVVGFTVVAAISTGIAAPGNMNSSLPGTTFVTSGMIYIGICLGFTTMCLYEIVNLRDELRELTVLVEDIRSPTDSEE